jgi:hypothetical protein
MAELKKYFGEKLCATAIPRNIRLAEAPSHGKPVLLYDVRSRGAESYIRLAKEIIAHYFAQTSGGDGRAAAEEATVESPGMMADAAAEQVTKAIEGASDQAAAEGVAGGEMQGPPGDETPAAEGEAAVEEMGKTA